MKKQDEKKEKSKKGEEKYSPYLDAKREWNERYGTYIKERDTWRMVALISLACVLLSVFWIGYIGSQNKLVPYLVEVDKLGRAVAAGPVQQVGMPNELIIKSQLASFIRHLRSVTTDTTVQKKWLFDAYAMVSQSDPSAQLITSHYGGGKGPNSPFIRAQTEMVEIEISTVLKQSDESWEVEWVETVRARKDGQILQQMPMRALLQTYISKPDTLKGIYTNPAGVYVKQFSWSKQN